LVVTSTLRHRRRFKNRVVRFVLPGDSKDSPNSEGKDIPNSSEWSSESLETYIRDATRYLRGRMQPIFDVIDDFRDWVEAAWKGITQPVFDLIRFVSESFDNGCVMISVKYNTWVGEQRLRLQAVLERLLEITKPLFDWLNKVQKWVEETVIWKWLDGKLRETISPVIAIFTRARESLDRKYRELARPVFDQFDLDGDG